MPHTEHQDHHTKNQRYDLPSIISKCRCHLSKGCCIFLCTIHGKTGKCPCCILQDPSHDYCIADRHGKRAKHGDHSQYFSYLPFSLFLTGNTKSIYRT